MTLFKEDIQEHLTASPIDSMARATFPGMAHFARTGPAGKTCRECVFWAHAPHDYRSFARKLVLTKRIRWFENTTGAPSVNHAWFIWDWQHKGLPVISYGPRAVQEAAE